MNNPTDPTGAVEETDDEVRAVLAARPAWAPWVRTKRQADGTLIADYSGTVGLIGLRLTATCTDCVVEFNDGVVPVVYMPYSARPIAPTELFQLAGDARRVAGIIREIEAQR